MLRTTLRPGLLKAIAFNESHRRPGVSLFEIGHAYPPGDGELPDEYEELAVVLAGREAVAAVEVWREIAAAMGFGARVDQSKPPAGLHPTRSATLSLGRDTIGAVGEVHPDVLDAYGVDERVAVLELDLSVLLSHRREGGGVEADQPFPVERSRSGVRHPRLGHRREGREGHQASGRRCCWSSSASSTCTEAPGVPADSRSLAYRLRLQALDRTLADVELTELRNKVIAGVGKLGATLR